MPCLYNHPTNHPTKSNPAENQFKPLVNNDFNILEIIPYHLLSDLTNRLLPDTPAVWHLHLNGKPVFMITSSVMKNLFKPSPIIYKIILSAGRKINSTNPNRDGVCGSRDRACPVSTMSLFVLIVVKMVTFPNNPSGKNLCGWRGFARFLPGFRWRQLHPPCHLPPDPCQ